jgi:hypothetical protein
MELFNNSYLPDRLDLLLDQDSIAMDEFLYVESLKANHSLINRVIKRIKNNKGA